MKNPTREEIERRLERVLIGPSNTVEMSVADYQKIHRFALRALDMREALREALLDVDRDFMKLAVRDILRRFDVASTDQDAELKAVKKFDEAGDG